MVVIAKEARRGEVRAHTKTFLFQAQLCGGMGL